MQKTGFLGKQSFLGHNGTAYESHAAEAYTKTAIFSPTVLKVVSSFHKPQLSSDSFLPSSGLHILTVKTTIC